MMSTGGSNPGTMLRHTHSAGQVLWSSSTLGTRTETGCQPGGGAGTHHPGSLGSRRQPPSVEAKGQTLPSHSKMGPRVDHRHEVTIMESGPLHRPHDPTQLLQAWCSPHPHEVSSPSVQAHLPLSFVSPWGYPELPEQTSRAGDGSTVGHGSPYLLAFLLLEHKDGCGDGGLLCKEKRRCFSPHSGGRQTHCRPSDTLSPG